MDNPMNTLMCVGVAALVCSIVLLAYHSAGDDAVSVYPIAPEVAAKIRGHKTPQQCIHCYDPVPPHRERSNPREVFCSTWCAVTHDTARVDPRGVGDTMH